MPLTRIICPHCEQSVEVAMTSVTRSRDCPLCGRTIMLQFTTQEKRQRRKALLTPAVTAEGSEAEEESPGLMVNPRPIQGDLRERMMLDPEVRQRVRVVKISLITISVIIAVVVLGSVFHWWSGIAGMVQQFNASKPSADDSGIAVKKDPPKSSWTDLLRAPTTTSEPPPTADVGNQNEAVILKVAASFLNAANVDERLNHILSRKTVEKKMREYYQSHPDGPVPYETIESLGEDSAVKDALDFIVTLKDGARRRLVMRKSQAKGYLVDWPSFVIFSEMEWDQFVNSRPQTPTLFRVTAGVADVYRNDFLDPQKLVCLKVNNPLDVHAPPIYAYAQRSSSLGRTLEFVMRRAAGTSVPLLLKLKFPEAGGGPDQVWVDEFVGEGWVSRNW